MTKLDDDPRWQKGPEPIRHGNQRDQFIDAWIRYVAGGPPGFWGELGDLAEAIMKDRETNG